MRIGIHGLFNASGGSLKNLRQLLSEWHASGAFRRHDFVLFASRHTQAALADLAIRELRVHHLPMADRGLAGRFIAEQIQLPRMLHEEQIDVLFCPANTMPRRTSVPRVVTFQNAAPFQEPARLARTRRRDRLRWWVLRRSILASARQAARIVYISRYFRELLESEFGIDKAKGVVIYRAREDSAKSAVSPADVMARYGIRSPYLLLVSHLYPYKNIAEVIEGYAIAHQSGELGDVQLVIAGGALLAPQYLVELQQRLTKHGLQKQQVLLAGDVPAREITPLLTGCEAFVFSSTCENCPNGLIEALSAGKAVACSNVGVMPEIAGPAARYFNPDDPADIAQALIELHGDANLRAKLSQFAIERAQSFPDSRSVAAATLAAIESAAPQVALRRAA